VNPHASTGLLLLPVRILPPNVVPLLQHQPHLAAQCLQLFNREEIRARAVLTYIEVVADFAALFEPQLRLVIPMLTANAAVRTTGKDATITTLYREGLTLCTMLPVQHSPDPVGLHNIQHTHTTATQRFTVFSPSVVSHHQLASGLQSFCDFPQCDKLLSWRYG
jgi:hypothetical protein